MNLEVLINEVEKRKALWDIHLGDYRNREMAAQHWMEIADIFGTSPVIIKKKWKSLRDNFRSELKKTKVLLKYGTAETTTSKRSKWSYFNRMSFLTNVMVNEKSPWKINSSLAGVKHNTSDLLSIAINKSDVTSEFISTFDDSEQQISDTLTTSDDQNEDSSSNSEISPSLKKICLVTHKEKQHSQTNGNLSEEKWKAADNVIINEIQSGQESNTVYDKNQNYNFLISFLPYMNNMSEMQNLQFRCKMSNILMECVETKS